MCCFFNNNTIGLTFASPLSPKVGTIIYKPIGVLPGTLKSVTWQLWNKVIINAAASVLGNEYLRLLLGVKKKKKRKIRNEIQPHIRPQWKPFHLAHCLISDLKAGLFCSFSSSPARHLTHTSVESFFNTCTNIFVIAFHLGFPNSLQEEKGTKYISQKYSSAVVFFSLHVDMILIIGSQGLVLYVQYNYTIKKGNCWRERKLWNRKERDIHQYWLGYVVFPFTHISTLYLSAKSALFLCMSLFRDAPCF